MPNSSLYYRLLPRAHYMYTVLNSLSGFLALIA